MAPKQGIGKPISIIPKKGISKPISRKPRQPVVRATKGNKRNF